MKLLSKFGDIKATYLTWLEARIGKSLVTAEKNSLTGGIEIDAVKRSFALSPFGVAVRSAISAADSRPDFAYRRPLKSGEALALSSTAVAGNIYLSDGSVWACTNGGTTGSAGPVVGSNPSDPVAAGAGTALFAYISAAQTPLTDHPDTPASVTCVRPNTLTGVVGYMPSSSNSKDMFSYPGTWGPVYRAGAAMPSRWVNGTNWYGSVAVPALIGYDQVRDKKVGFTTRSKRVAIDGIGNYSPRIVSIEINGNPLQDAGIFNDPGTLGGGNSVLLLTFATRAKRTFWISVPRDNEWGGVYVDAGEKITKPTIGGVRAVFEGDSLTENLANPSNLFNRGSWPDQLCQRLGIHDCWNLAVGGTGFLNPGSSSNPITSAKRIETIINAAPDVIFVGGAHNDISNGVYTSAKRLAAMRQWYSAIRAALPAVIVHVFGSTPLRGESRAVLAEVDSDLAAWVDGANAAGDYLITFHPVIDANGDPWVPDGTVGPYFRTAGDAHPAQAGIDQLVDLYHASLLEWYALRC